MSKKLFVGNINWQASQEELQDLFAQHGQIEEAVIIHDRSTGRSKGFGFVTFTDDQAADAAVQALNGQEFQGRPLVVNEARPPQAKN